MLMNIFRVAGQIGSGFESLFTELAAERLFFRVAGNMRIMRKLALKSLVTKIAAMFEIRFQLFFFFLGHVDYPVAFQNSISGKSFGTDAAKKWRLFCVFGHVIF